MTVQRYGCSMPRQTVGTTGWSCLWYLLTCGLYLLVTITPASAVREVKVAIVVPLSGRWARQGELCKTAADMAIADINTQGGIHALGGAKMVLVPADAGDSLRQTTGAVQRVFAAGDMSAAQGAWLRSYTGAATAVAERFGIPWLTSSWSDKMAERGLQYTFQSSPVASQLAALGLAQVVALGQTHGVSVKRVALVGDNTAAMVSALRSLRENVFPKLGISIAMEAVYAPPLPDATAIVHTLRTSRPDLLISGMTAHHDIVILWRKMQELQVKVPSLGFGVPFTTTELRDGIGAALLEGLMATVASHQIQGQEELAKRFQDRTHEAWLTQDAVSSYAEIWIIKEAIEKAASADPVKVRAALASLNLYTGPAAQTFFPGYIRFDAQGRRVDAVPVLVQWQDGLPYTVYPAAGATRPAVWPK